jgi:hypothetical protein
MMGMGALEVVVRPFAAGVRHGNFKDLHSETVLPAGVYLMRVSGSGGCRAFHHSCRWNGFRRFLEEEA